MSMSSKAFNGFLILLAVLMAGFGLDRIPRGPAHAFSASDCGKNSPKILVPEGGVPCTGTRQDYGWPVHSSSRFTDQKSTDGRWVSQRDYQCIHGCGRYYKPSYNAGILLIVVFGGLGIWKWWGDRQIDKKLFRLEMGHQRKKDGTR